MYSLKPYGNCLEIVHPLLEYVQVRQSAPTEQCEHFLYRMYRVRRAHILFNHCLDKKEKEKPTKLARNLPENQSIGHCQIY